MKRHLIVGRYGPGDRSRLPLGDGEVETRLDIVVGERSLDHGIGRALSDLIRLGVYPSETGVDLLVLAAHVHAADTRVSRSSESQDGWTRELRLVVPVADPDRWRAATPTFVRMLNFLTGDRWSLAFRARPRRFARVAPTPPGRLIGPPFNDLALFSGGLDSLIGAIDTLEASRTQPGTGLGLSLVAAVARLHHGEVRLEDNHPGLKVVVLLSGKCLTSVLPGGVSTPSDVAAGVAAQ